LLGTDLLKAYMHGFFIDLRLYEKAKAIANPFAYNEYRERMVREKLEQQRQSRISAVNKLPKVNRAAAARLLQSQQAESGKKKRGEAKEVAKLDADGKPVVSAQNPLGMSFMRLFYI
jgi:ribosome biogenesis protein ENP2